MNRSRWRWVMSLLYNPTRTWRSSPAHRSARSESCRCSAPAAWAKCTSPGHPARPRHRAESSARRVRRGCRAAAPIRARSQVARGAEPSQHRSDLRHRPDRGGPRTGDRDGIRRRTMARYDHGADAGRRTVADRAADRGRARGGARQRHHPPRPEAREHQDQGRRHREGAGFRTGESV